MRRLLGWLFTLITLLNAEPIIIDAHFEYTKASPFMEYVADINHSLSIETIHEAHWQPMKSSNLGGFNDYPSWTRVSLKNVTPKRQRVLIKNPRADMDEIDVYILRKDEINTIVLGDQYPIANRNVPHRYSVDVLELAPYEEIQIVAKLINPIGSTEGEWEIFTRKYFIDFTMSESLWWGIFIGIYIALFFYSVPILSASNNKILTLYFGGYAVSSIGYQLALNGIFYTWGLHGIVINLCILLLGLAFFLFTLLIMHEFLKLTHHNGILSRLLYFMIFVLFIDILLSLSFYLFQPNFLRYTAILTSYISLLSLPLWLILFSKLFQLSNDKAYRYIFLGYTAIFVAHAYQIMINLGIFPIHPLSIYSVSLGSMLEMYFFSLSISLYIKEIQNKALVNQQLLDFQMRFASIGRVIGNITHQWKMPMIRACSLLTHMEALIHFKNKKTLAEIEELIPQIRSHFIFMQNTIDEFYSLYGKDTKKTHFHLINVINDVWGMLSSKVSACEMKLHIKDLHNTQLYSYEHSFAHIMIILMDNTLNAMKQCNISNPHMSIEILHERDVIQLSFEDNCGGISHDPIESIFDVTTSSKPASEGIGGLGLAIVKLLVTEKFGGTISVANTAHGVRFVLSIPKELSTCY